MQHASRTVAEAVAIGITLSAALGGCYWILHHYLGFSKEFTAAVIVPTAIACFFAAIYGYYVGWIRYRIGSTPDAVARINIFQRRFRLVVFSALVGLPLLLAAASFTLTANASVAVLLVILGLAIAPWALKKIRAELARRKSTSTS